MALRELQLLWENSDYGARKALESSASVVQPALLAALGKYESGNARKIVITVPERGDHSGPVISPLAPSEVDDDVELLTTSATLPSTLLIYLLRNVANWL